MKIISNDKLRIENAKISFQIKFQLPNLMKIHVVNVKFLSSITFPSDIPTHPVN